MTSGYNERSWAIDVIAEIKRLADRERRTVKGAGGERTLTSGGERLFPDVLLYGDPSGTAILQGWELKMPDTPITDDELISNARTKAVRLGLDSFLVWNAKTAVLHIQDEGGEFQPEHTWEVLAGAAREDVSRREAEWKAGLAEILDDLNGFFEDGQLHGRTLVESLSQTDLIGEALNGAPALAEALQVAATRNGHFNAEVALWWGTVQQEYPDQSEPWLPLAKLVLLAWVNRFVFGNLLARRCATSTRVRAISEDFSASEALEEFRVISEACDFVNILQATLGSEHTDGLAWRIVLQLNGFLADLALDGIDQEVFSGVLDALIHAAQRKAAGQFTTPTTLADLLARLVLLNREGVFADPFCGTGTIPRQAYRLKRSVLEPDEAYASIWASDKFDIPVQITTISLTDPEAMGIPIRVIQSDVVELRRGREFELVDPGSGENIVVQYPALDAVATNLPFVQFEEVGHVNPEIPQINNWIVGQLDNSFRLPARSDLYAYLPFYIWQLLQEGGRLGIILSNSWLGTGFGETFRRSLSAFYHVERIVVSGRGRWFENTDVVTTMMVLSRRETPRLPDDTEEISFSVLRESLATLSAESLTEEVASRIILQRPFEHVDITTLTVGQIRQLETLGLQWSAFFANTEWILEIQDHLVRVGQEFDIGRGERRGWNEMFYPDPGHGIEVEYIRPVLRSSASVQGLIADPDAEAFCCSETIETLERRGDRGALRWIRRFERETNTTGEPLPQVLERSGSHWYEMSDSTVADIVGLMAPSERLFFPRMRERGFVDQRLVRFTGEPGSDFDLAHALLNAIPSLYYLEGIGFGRGLGALDLNSTKMKSRLRMLSPSTPGDEERERILEAFEPLLGREVLPLREELAADDRRNFDEIVLQTYGAAHLLDDIYDAILTLHQIRLAAIE